MNKTIKKTKKKTKSNCNTKLNFSSLVVVFSIVSIIIFTIATFIVSINGYAISDELIRCFFVFFGVELLSLAGIKIGKSKYGQLYEDIINEEVTEE